MSDELRDVRERTPAACPWCGYNGAFDGRGPFTRTFTIRRPDGTEELARESWSKIGCTECGREFGMKNRETTVDVTDEAVDSA